ncbi:MAG: hypothetical protein EA398_03730 [Deltaproteobacteria bacterium]|nr:MAG: hypothetical protein EA398_03730 [Deltaproteobacteria bacterium]
MTSPPNPRQAPGRPRRRWQRWAIDIAILVAVVLAIQAWQGRDHLPRGADSDAPAFQLATIAGGTLSLDDLRGDAVALHFWATWCAACRTELGALERLHNRTPDGRRLVTIAVNSGDAETLQAFADERGLSFPILIDDGTVAARYRVSAFPTTYYLSPGGSITSSDVGISTTTGMRFRLWRAARRG